MSTMRASPLCKVKAKFQPVKGRTSARKKAVDSATRNENSWALQASFAEIYLSPREDAV